ncbi:MAG TPA: fluoride efflux transporter CrcB [Afifellaceae bacterium]|nr:fluoride efflux transporter CrcB [Afifellaceae bacterium]
MTHLLLVAAGGAIGAALRHLVGLGALRLFGAGFPVGTLTVNVAGSFAMGLLIGWLALRAAGGGQNLRLFLATGVLGGFTTFSAFSAETVLLWERGAAGAALGYVAASVVASIAALVAGLAIVRAVA